MCKRPGPSGNQEGVDAVEPGLGLGGPGGVLQLRFGAHQPQQQHWQPVAAGRQIVRHRTLLQPGVPQQWRAHTVGQHPRHAIANPDPGSLLLSIPEQWDEGTKQADGISLKESPLPKLSSSVGEDDEDDAVESDRATAKQPQILR
ncbi:hypothetical protein AAFF_G00412370 [Aldrovandia affinis]|uniref:Uncharacterized protein n=1 Tax=Aldrovandia affinis TaxID=143900 RepID=A0AAD7R3F8_9TELE|nr:hypothetical protein AAFF_G00412370 [Aldrovandia affinis]